MTGVLSEEKNIVPARHEDDVSGYMREIRRYPVLTAQQERELAIRCAQGDSNAIRELVNSNLRLVVSVAREYAGRGVPLLDLIQEGSIGLLAAAKKFDYTKECRFSTYATKWIEQGVNRAVMNHAGVIRVPLHTQQQIRKVLAAKVRMKQEYGQEPDLQQIALECDFPEEKVSKLLSLIPEVCSLEASVGEDGDSEMMALLEDLQAPQPQEELIRRELKKILGELLDTLPPRHSQVLRLRFGMEDGLCLSFQEIAQELGVSKERARQIEGQAMDKLQKLGNSLGLEDFLE